MNIVLNDLSEVVMGFFINLDILNCSCYSVI